MAKNTFFQTLTLLVLISVHFPWLAMGSGEDAESASIFVGASSNNFPPVNLLDEDGNLIGFGKELSEAVIQSVGGRVQHRHSPLWPKVLGMLDSGEADFIHDTGYSKERTKFLDYSAPILTMSERIFVRAGETDISDIDSLKGKTVACVNRHVTHLYLRTIPGINCRIVHTPIEALYLLESGLVDAWVFPEQIALYFANRFLLAGKIKAVGSELRRLQWSMVVKKGNREMLELLNRGIKNIRGSGEYERIYEKWFGRGLLDGYRKSEVQAIAIAVGVSCLFAGISLGLFALYLRQRRFNWQLSAAIKAKEVAQANFQSGESLLRSVFEYSPVIISVKDKDGRYIMVNKAFTEMTKIPQESVLGKTYRESGVRTEQEVYDTVEMEDQKVLTEGMHITSLRSPITTPDGNLGWRSKMKGPIRDDTGDIVGLVTISQNITEQAEIEQELRENQALLRSTFDAIPSPIVVRDRAHKPVMVNRARAALLDSTPEKFMQLPEGYAVFKDEMESEVKEKNLQVMETGATLDYELETVGKDGAAAHRHIIRAPLRGPDGEISGTVYVAEDITDRIRFEKALMEREALLQAVFDNSPINIAVKDKDRRYILANRSYAQTYALDQNAVEGKTFRELRPGDKDNLQHIDEEDHQVLVLEKKMESTRLVTVNADGQKRWISAVKVPLRDEAGDVIGLVGVSQDITEIREAEEARRKAEQQFSAMVENSPTSITLRNLDGRFLFANQNFLTRYGYTMEQLRGKKLEEVFPYPHKYDTVRRNEEMERKVVETGMPQEEEIIAGSMGKGDLVIAVTKFPVFGTDGEMNAIGTFGMDVTERYRATQEMALSEEKYRNLVEGSIQGIWVNTGTRLVFANRALAKFLGYDSPEEILGLGDVLNLIAPDYRQRIMSLATARLQGEIVEPHSEFQGLRKDGSLIWLEAFSHRVSWRGTLAVQVTLIDITKRKTAERRVMETLSELEESQLQLVHAGKMVAIGQLAAGIAHEINNPLASISSSAEILSSVTNGSEEKQHESLLYKHLERIQNNVFRCKAIVHNMLSFVRNEKPYLEWIDVRKSLETAVELAKNSPDARDRQFEIVCMPFAENSGENEPIAFFTIAQQFQQVFLNLLLNSVHATDPGDNIRVEITPMENEILFSVSDTGRGISAEDLDNIFQPFFTTKSSGYGTGLGLALCRQIVDSQGGHIEADSKLGEGTTMRVVFPSSEEYL